MIESFETMLDKVGEEYYQKVGSASKEDQDRITQLDTYPDQLMKMIATGAAIKKQYEDAYAIDSRKGKYRSEIVLHIKIQCMLKI